MSITPDNVIQRYRNRLELQQNLNWPEIPAFLVRHTDLTSEKDAAELLQLLGFSFGPDLISGLEGDFFRTLEGPNHWVLTRPLRGNQLLRTVEQESRPHGSAKILLERLRHAELPVGQAAELVAARYGWTVEEAMRIINELDPPNDNGHIQVPPLRDKLKTMGAPEPFPQWYSLPPVPAAPAPAAEGGTVEALEARQDDAPPEPNGGTEKRNIALQAAAEAMAAEELRLGKKTNKGTIAYRLSKTDDWNDMTAETIERNIRVTWKSPKKV